MSFFGTTDPRLNRGMGIVPGQTDGIFAGIKTNIVSTGFETLWDLIGSFTFPTGAETWEVISDSTADTLLGTGARKVLVLGLDTSYAPQSEIIEMNGITAVITTRTDWLRVEDPIVIDSGSGQTNAGTITLRVSVAGAVRATILPTFGRSFNGFTTVPLGKRMFITKATGLAGKGVDVDIINRLTIFGSNTILSGGAAPIYQSSNPIDFASYPTFPEKTDLEITAATSQANITASLQIDFTLVDNDQIELNPAGEFSRGF